jgi:hypothetical protein
MTQNILSKSCNKCGQEKPHSDFCLRKKSKDGLNWWCKSCSADYLRLWKLLNAEKKREANKKWREENPDKVKESAAKWYAKNSQKSLAYTKLWYESNKEKALATRAAWRAANKERAMVATKAWQAKNRDKVRAAVKKWQQLNPDAVKSISQNRRARKMQTAGKLSPNLSKKLFALQKGKCACCKKPLGDDYHMDHIMPLALGGTNTDDNIQLLRAKCNNQKYKKHPIDFMQERGYLL